MSDRETQRDRRAPCLLIRRLSLVLFLLATCSPAVIAATPFEVLRFGVVHLGEQVSEGTPRWLGTGFLVDGRCTFLTAKHVLVSVREREKLVVRFQNPAGPSKVVTRPVRVLHEEPESDLAFVVVDKIDDKPCSSGSLYIFPLTQDTPSHRWVGAPVVIIGFPVLGDPVDIPVLRKGHLSSVEIRIQAGPPSLLLDLFGVPGFSGSPVVLEETGEVIGVVYGPGPTQRTFGFEWATPVTRHVYDAARATAVK